MYCGFVHFLRGKVGLYHSPFNVWCPARTQLPIADTIYKVAKNSHSEERLRTHNQVHLPQHILGGEPLVWVEIFFAVSQMPWSILFIY